MSLQYLYFNIFFVRPKRLLDNWSEKTRFINKYLFIKDLVKFI